MKKLVLMIAAVAALTFVSCENKQATEASGENTTAVDTPAIDSLGAAADSVVSEAADSAVAAVEEVAADAAAAVEEAVDSAVAAVTE